jgi:undecaprenyl-diphosphatase
MSFIEAILLGILQGISEFFPISSSFHLKLFKNFLKIETISPFFYLSCHLGTAFSALIFLRKEIKNIFLSKKINIFFIFLAILPLIPMYLFFKHLNFLSHSFFPSFFLIISSLFLFSISYRTYNTKIINSSLKRKSKDVLFIGIMQAIALFPGISRSGSTISAACWRGWSIKESISFSYLLAIPTIFGGTILEMIKLIKNNPIDNCSIMNCSILNCSLGFLFSFILGFITIRFIFSFKTFKKFKFFAWYCLFLGILTLFM